MAESLDADTNSEQSTSNAGKDDRRTNIKKFLKCHEHLCLYQPLTITRSRSSPTIGLAIGSTLTVEETVVLFSTADTRWKLTIENAYQLAETYYPREGKACLLLLSGAKRTTFTCEMRLVSRYKEEDKDDHVYQYWYGADILCVNSEHPKSILKLLPGADCAEMRNQSEYAVLLYLEILQITPAIPTPMFTLDTDIQSAAANEEFQDVTLIVGEERQEVKTNKFMLMARSPVFTRMFNSEMKEKENGIVVIPDVRHEVCMEMLSFMYTGKVSELKNLQTTKELLLAAEKYNLVRLKAICENRIALSLSVGNAAHILSFANMYCSEELKDSVIRFITSDNDTCSEVIKSEGWKEVEEQGAELVTAVMSKLVMPSESRSVKRPRLT